MHHTAVLPKEKQATTDFDKGLQDWIEKEKKAVELIGIVAQLWYDHSVELVIFRRQLIDQSPSAILNLHLHAREIVKQDLNIHDTLPIAKALVKLDLAPSRIDLGRLAKEWLEEKGEFKDLNDFLRNKLSDHIGKEKKQLEPRDVVLYGFGRIGRLVARVLVAKTGHGEQLRLRAIVTRGSADQLEKRAELLRNDSIHGPFDGTTVVDQEKELLIINGQPIHMISADRPEDVDYTQYGIENALIIDNTGAWRDEEGLSRHLKSKGAANVLLTAPGKGNLPNVVYGVNHEQIDQNGSIFSAASCTTNAIVPVLKVVNDHFGIEFGHIETVHSYTNDQNLLDNVHKKYRRGRSAPLNLVITETGAGKAVAKALPELEGKLTGNSVRVPTPNGSLVILNLTFKKETNLEELNSKLKEASLHGRLVEQIEFSENKELVSSDIIGNPHSSIVDGAATIISPSGKQAVLYIWYDNEYGYTEQVVRFAKHIADVRRLTYY